VLDGGTLAADASAPPIKVVVRVDDDDDLVNIAMVDSRTDDPRLGNNRARETTKVIERPEPHSIGYWKRNCTVDVLPQTLGAWNVDNCDDAIDILNKRSTEGRKRANDGAYKLSSQLLAAQLNLDSGAGRCSAVERAMTAGNNLLERISFDGTGSYLTRNSSLRSQAISLAEVLDDYNDDDLC
jgi:hypothetical protein